MFPIEWFDDKKYFNTILNIMSIVFLNNFKIFLKYFFMLSDKKIITNFELIFSQKE